MSEAFELLERLAVQPKMKSGIISTDDGERRFWNITVDAEADKFLDRFLSEAGAARETYDIEDEDIELLTVVYYDGVSMMARLVEKKDEFDDMNNYHPREKEDDGTRFERWIGFESQTAEEIFEGLMEMASGNYATRRAGECTTFDLVGADLERLLANADWARAT